MSASAVVEHYRIEDYRRWQGDWELIQGIPLAMSPSPGVRHQRVARRLLRQLDEALDHCPRCEAFHGIDVELSDDTVTRPDVIVICFEPDGDRITRAPALIAEVVSPKTARRDEQTKFQLYRDEGVGYYILLYPNESKAKVYQLIDGEYRKLGDFHRESCPINLPGCRIELDFARLWPRQETVHQRLPDLGGTVGRSSGSRKWTATKLDDGVEDLEKQHPGELADALCVAVDAVVLAHDVLDGLDGGT